MASVSDWRWILVYLALALITEAIVGLIWGMNAIFPALVGVCVGAAGVRIALEVVEGRGGRS